MARRADGEGSLYQRKDGRWVGEPPPRLAKKPVYGRTRKEAATKLRNLIRDLEAGRQAPDRTITVAAWLDRHLDELSDDLSPNTHDNHAWAAKLITSEIGSIKLVDLTPFDVEQALGRLRDRPLARNSVMRAKIVLGQALRSAEKHGLVLRNSAKLADMPAKGWNPSSPRRSFTKEQADAFIAVLEEERLGQAFFTSLVLGLRPGEVCGLCWDSVDLDDGVIHVSRSLKRDHGKELSLGDVKSARSRRSIRAPEFLVDRLRSHRVLQAEERLAMGPCWTDWDLVFPTEVGTPVDPSNYRRSFKRAAKKAGLDDWTPYELRHSALSLLSDAGVPIEHVSDIAGHNDTRTTMSTYRHPVRPVIEHAAEPMQRLFGEHG